MGDYRYFSVSCFSYSAAPCGNLSKVLGSALLIFIKAFSETLLPYRIIRIWKIYAM